MEILESFKVEYHEESNRVAVYMGNDFIGMGHVSGGGFEVVKPNGARFDFTNDAAMALEFCLQDSLTGEQVMRLQRGPTNMNEYHSGAYTHA